MADNKRVTLPQALERLQPMSRDQAIFRIANGELDGGQDLGRWFVTVESIDRYLAAEQSQ